ncbi:hypothetical protein M9H77_17873 [Catharanthus roseus]|uniref:Uncharacterized protein n=1 Tax=Catharanthus roseus TaxID=4058 RepID=A0ACC0B5U4_CATRO|nr:hypothetical protein M9H77_17873 [Catharanthus roseus]
MCFLKKVHYVTVGTRAVNGAGLTRTRTGLYPFLAGKSQFLLQLHLPATAVTIVAVYTQLHHFPNPAHRRHLQLRLSPLTVIFFISSSTATAGPLLPPMSGTIPTQSSKASTAATDDMEITNYNELNVEENLEDQSRRALAKMIIKHNYPFNMCEHEFFEKFCNSLNPNFKLKMRLYEFLDGLDCRITLTTDIWTSEHANIAYTCLTAHFVDDNWELKKKILAYRHIPYSHDGETLFRFINDLILEWNLDKKLFCMVVDNASSNDAMVRHLKS